MTAVSAALGRKRSVLPDRRTPGAMLDSLGVLDRLRADGRVFGTTPEAIAYARAHLSGQGIPADRPADAKTPAGASS